MWAIDMIKKISTIFLKKVEKQTKKFFLFFIVTFDPKKSAPTDSWDESEYLVDTIRHCTTKKLITLVNLNSILHEIMNH